MNIFKQITINVQFCFLSQIDTHILVEATAILDQKLILDI